jgi:predicted RND superfamily exporter protein
VTEATHRALMTSGNAIVITALTMVLPLVPWIVMSPLRFQSEMSMLLGMVLIMNMLGALLFVPAALAALRPKAIFPRNIAITTAPVKEKHLDESLVLAN